MKKLLITAMALSCFALSYGQSCIQFAGFLAQSSFYRKEEA